MMSWIRSPLKLESRFEAQGIIIRRPPASVPFPSPVLIGVSETQVDRALGRDLETGADCRNHDHPIPPAGRIGLPPTAPDVGRKEQADFRRNRQVSFYISE